MTHPVDPSVRNPVGAHLAVGRGLARGALATAVGLGHETLQVFVGNPQGWKQSAGDPVQDAAFRDGLAEHGVRAFVHSPYLVNLGSPTPLTRERSVEAVAHTLRRAADIGAEGVVVHTGSCVGTDASYDAAMGRVREGLLPLLDGLDDDGPLLLLEPTAGQGRSLCGRVDDLAPYLAALDHHPRLGLCLDTCHVFAAGDPLDEPGGTTTVLDRVVEIGGPDLLRLVHANDSVDGRGSQRDRHARLGRGRLGLRAFRELLVHPATEGVPLVLETPGDRVADDPDVAILRALRGDDLLPTGVGVREAP